jgi:hypothetical protein
VTSTDRWVRETLPDSILESIRTFERRFGALVRVTCARGGGDRPPTVLHASPGFDGDVPAGAAFREVVVGSGDQAETWELGVATDGSVPPDDVLDVLMPVVAYVARTGRELDQFTYELSERFEEINLLYSISETLGTTLDLVDAAHQMLAEVRDVMGAKRGSIWVYRYATDSPPPRRGGR